jgi:hypothetical protein
MLFNDPETLYLILYCREDLRQLLRNILIENWPEEVIMAAREAEVVLRNKVKEG